ncbi:transglycosylase SLT domain-containing protein [Saccharomonospora sp. NB11]|uniref:transglycosylase SLT domain-containing protein n=1 Tax=Saccharomonospora sp. NB11 TaxID=1642298 RepID=UPI0018D0A22E|nr:transglycosylase SLT domain-containing protein [Saccharomonospora sp. NB11]
MANHKMFERVKRIIALQAPTRDISTPATSFGRTVRDAARSYASVGVLALFVTGVASPAILAGTDDDAASTAETHNAAVVQQHPERAQGDGPTGGGAPAPRSADPAVAQNQQAEAEEEAAPEAAEQPEAEAEPAAGGGAQPAAAAEPIDALDGWIREAIGVMQANGINVSEADVDSIRTVIEKESSGDPRAINLWDINAKRGTPSKGLMQTIDSTFNAHKLPGYDDIYDPVSNIIAGTRYTLDRYGSFAEHPGLAQMATGGGYRGY